MYEIRIKQFVIIPQLLSKINWKLSSMTNGCQAFQDAMLLTLHLHANQLPRLQRCNTLAKQ